MQTPEDFAKRLREREIDYVWDGEDETKVDDGFAMSDEYAVKEIAARDAEWQARVDALLEDNNRSEEQVKKQFANAVGFKARAEKAEARVDRLTAALKQYANRDNWELDEEHNTFRRWLEPDSYTPYAYNGFSIARAALADVAHMVLTTATVYTPPELIKAATEALRKAGEIPGEVGG